MQIKPALRRRFKESCNVLTSPSGDAVGKSVTPVKTSTEFKLSLDLETMGKSKVRLNFHP